MILAFRRFRCFLRLLVEIGGLAWRLRRTEVVDGWYVATDEVISSDIGSSSVWWKNLYHHLRRSFRQKLLSVGASHSTGIKLATGSLSSPKSYNSEKLMKA